MSTGSKRLDHGELNVPLAKRGNLDAQIDEYKWQQAAAAANAARLARKNVREAHAAVRALAPESMDGFCAKTGRSRAQVRKELHRAAWSDPDFVLRWCAEHTT